MKVWLAVLLIGGLVQAKPGRDQLASLEFEQKLNQPVPLELSFTDDNAAQTTLGEILARGKPAILVPGYYGCPMLCTLVLNGLVDSLQRIKLTVGKDFAVVFFSINPEEQPALAAAKKRAYIKLYGRSEQGWHFLTAQGNQAAELSKAIGFKYLYDGSSQQYAHPSGLVVLTPEGRIARYFFGIEYPPKKLRDALVLAGGGRIGTAAERLVLLCFHDPATAYSAGVLWAVRALALLGTLLVGLFVFSQIRSRTSAR